MRRRENDIAGFFFIIDLMVYTLILLVVFGLMHVSSSLESSIYFLHGSLSLVVTHIVYSKRYLFINKRLPLRFMTVVWQMLVFVSLAMILALLVLPSSYINQLFVICLVVFFLVELLLYWCVQTYYAHKQRTGKSNSLIIIGYNETGFLLKSLIDDNPILGYSFKGYVCDQPNGKGIVGSFEYVEALIEEKRVQTIVVVNPLFFQSFDLTSLTQRCQRAGIRLYYVPENGLSLQKQPTIDTLKLIWINPRNMPLDNVMSKSLKRGFDIGFSVLLLGLLSWLGLIIALVIKLTYKGSIIIAQNRQGLYNKEFAYLRFRCNDVDDSGNLFGFGRFIRKTRLDLLPQLLTVIAGKMSFVGPYPLNKEQVLSFSAQVPHYLSRYFIKPGMTGWAQVNGLHKLPLTRENLEKTVDYDIKYLEEWSFWWDVKLIAMAVANK